MPQDRLTPEQRADYLEHEGHYCPFCQSEELDTGEMNSDSNYLTLSISCNDCHGEWQDYYQLTDVLNGDGSHVSKEIYVPGIAVDRPE